MEHMGPKYCNDMIRHRAEEIFQNIQKNISLKIFTFDLRLENQKTIDALIKIIEADNSSYYLVGNVITIRPKTTAVTINGQTYRAEKSLEIKDDKIFIDNLAIENGKKFNGIIKIELLGQVGSVICDTSLNITGTIVGDAQANSITCGDIAGNVVANIVNCKSIEGSIKGKK